MKMFTEEDYESDDAIKFCSDDYGTIDLGRYGPFCSLRHFQEGVVLEARVQEGLGVLGTVMVQRGELRPGDGFVGADLTSNGSIDANAEPDAEPVAAATTATADATTTDTQCDAAGGAT